MTAAVNDVAPLHRTLEQELQALLRGVSLECLVCGEFVLHAGGMVTCPECAMSLRTPAATGGSAQLRLETSAG
jgi:ribosomal protein S27E